MYKVCPMPNESLIKIAHKEDFKGPRKRGRPRKRWSDQVTRDSRPDCSCITAVRPNELVDRLSLCSVLTGAIRWATLILLSSSRE